MKENWWSEWRSITYEGLNAGEMQLVRCTRESVLNLQQHWLMYLCFMDLDYRLTGLTNNHFGWYNDFYRNENFPEWYERIIWYVRRENEILGGGTRMNEMTVLCMYGEIDGDLIMQIILCRRYEGCRCDNIPTEAVLADSTVHVHLEPICECEFPDVKANSRAFRENQLSNLR